MKLQILQLKPNDDLVSAREQLSWVKADRVLLVWPRHGKPLQRRLDLVLLERKASQQGLLLGLVTHDPVVRDHAARLQIPVFDSVESIQESRWKRALESQPPLSRPEEDSEAEPELPPEPPDTPSRRATQRTPLAIRIPFFALGVSAFFALVAVLVPSATLIATPQTEARRAEGRVVLDPGLQAADVLSRRIPARLVRTEVSGAMRIRSSGQSAEPSSRAQGAVIFTNLTDDAHSVPIGTSVRTREEPAQRFLTTEEARVPAGRGESVEVSVEAAEPGREGNVAAGAIQAVDGPLGLALEVDNPEPVRGGSATLQPAVTVSDHERLRAELTEQLLSQAGADLRAELESGASLTASSLQIDRRTLERFDRDVGDIGASVGLELELQVSGLAYTFSDLRAVAEDQVTLREPAGWAPIPGSLAVQVNRTGGTQREGVSIHYGSTWTSYRLLPEEAIVSDAAGAPPDSLEDILPARYSLEDVGVRMWPAWLPRLPFLTTRIDIVYPWEAGP
ncbi:MAG: baseplate J/gp47 family protein [Anaerolineales bacterium]|nr:baseplate J/gp47 family protein [Anaerolineales bacterium]